MNADLWHAFFYIYIVLCEHSFFVVFIVMVSHSAEKARHSRSAVTQLVWANETSC